MRRSFLIIIIILGLAGIFTVTSLVIRHYAVDAAAQKLNAALQKVAFQINDYDAPITSPFCYQNIQISGPEQAEIQIKNLCLKDGLMSIIAGKPQIIATCEKISGALDWKTLNELKKQHQDKSETQRLNQNASLDMSVNLNIHNIDIKLGNPGKQISWKAQNSDITLKNHQINLTSVSPLKIDISRAPFAFSNMPVMTLTAEADLKTKNVYLQIKAQPAIALNTVWHEKMLSAQISNIDATLSENKNIILGINDTMLTAETVPAITQAKMKRVQAVLHSQKLKPQTIQIMEPEVTIDVQKMLADPNVRANPVFNTLIEFWQQEAGAILGKAPKDSVRREDVKKAKPPVRKNPIPRETLEKFRNTFANFQHKLKKLPTIDIQQGKITILNHHAHFDIQEIALNTESIFGDSNNDFDNHEKFAQNSKNEAKNNEINNVQTEIPNNDEEKHPQNLNDRNKNNLNQNLKNDMPQQEPLPFRLAFNVRNAEASFSIGFDKNTPFPSFMLNIRNLDAADFLRLVNMPIPDKSSGELSLHLQSAISEKTFDIHGNIALSNFAFFHEKISPNLIQNINASAAINAVYDFDTDNLRMDDIALTSGPITLNGFIHVTNVRSHPIISFELGAKDIPCQDIPKAIPTGFLPTITDLQITGTTMSPKLSGKIPWKAPLTSSLKESGFENRCIPTSVLPHMPEILNNADYTFTTNYTYFTDAITVGPGTDTYIPLSQIPPYVKAAMYLTEDKRFFDHGPLRISFIERALRLNLNQRSYVYGGSTISQQLTKNLFLTRSKNLARKLEEAFIAWRMETVVPKSRIFELYLNVIEFGPDIYGIKNAAHFYFDKTPAELTPLEGAFLASLKVSPSKGARFYKTGFPQDGRWWNKRLKYILKVLAENGYISPADVISAHNWIPEFFSPVDTNDDRKIWLDNYT